MKKVVVRPDRCTGCKACVIACAIEHSVSKNLFSAIFESPRPSPRIYVEEARGVPVPVHCHHCEDAPCVNACISGAMYRDRPPDGAVLLRQDRCIGCWSCIMVCPYGVIARRRNGRQFASKCDLCPEREVPACVSSCPTGALEFAEVEMFSKQRRLEAAAAIPARG